MEGAIRAMVEAETQAIQERMDQQMRNKDETIADLRNTLESMKEMMNKMMDEKPEEDKKDKKDGSGRSL